MSTALSRTVETLVLSCLWVCLLVSAAHADVAASGKERDAHPSASDADLAAIADGNLAFAASLYSRQRPGTNLFYSPYSITTALAMLFAGARGNTTTQMAATLHYTLPGERLHPAFNRLEQVLADRAKPGPGDQPGFKLNVANATWGQTGYTFLPSYLDTLAVNYGAGLRTVDFLGAPEPSRQTINDWVAQKTADRIKDLVPRGAITPATSLVLTNAIYFLAPWQTPFPKRGTADAPFHRLDGSSVSAPLMHVRGPFVYGTGDGWQAIDLPYAGGALAMTAVLPAAGRFDELDRSLAAAAWQPVFASLKGGSHQQVLLGLPRFTTTSGLSLSQDLQALGMTDAFGPAADLSGIDGKRGLSVSDVIHKAFVKVNEEGTEAAAATAVIVGRSAMPAPALTLTFDRPFLFLIRDVPTGTVLFVGRIVDPTA